MGYVRHFECLAKAENQQSSSVLEKGGGFLVVSEGYSMGLKLE